jgi:hypothetical protein
MESIRLLEDEGYRTPKHSRAEELMAALEGDARVSLVV